MRSLALLLALAPLLGQAADASREELWRALAGGGHVALMRHARAPGTGDPPEFQLGDCSTQRNLDASGRAQARAAGEAFRKHGVAPARVLTSQWCRCRETAELMQLGEVEDFPTGLNSFFRDRSKAGVRLGVLRQFLTELEPESGTLLLISHQVNITGLTDVWPRSGEVVVLKLKGADGFEVVGTMLPESGD